MKKLILINASIFSGLYMQAQETVVYNAGWIGTPELIIILIVTLLTLPVYFVPTIIALIRKTKKKTSIILLNILLGWTFLGWVGALIWAITDTTEKEFNLKYNLNESARTNQNSADETEP